MERKCNFYAGPATLPLPVLEKLRDTMVEYGDSGMSLIETSHRSPVYDEVHAGARELVRELLGLSDEFQVLFLGGGATLQFAMLPMNLMNDDPGAEYTLTGNWAKKALDDAKKLGKVNVIFDGSGGNFTDLPDAGALKPQSGAAYLHLTSNETIQGLQWQDWPDTGSVPLAVDMSSDIMSRTLPVERFSLIYAGAQKNLGPAGVTLVIMRKGLLERCRKDLPAYLSYPIHADKDSLYNTPPVFSIYAVKLVLEWIKEQGGLQAMEELNERKAGLLYSAIDESDGFYQSPVSSKDRSRMNVVFTMPDEQKQKLFLSQAQEAGMVGLKGHRSVGGCRASIYNAMPYECVHKLADFMRDFRKKA
ncbi:MAG: 3-phosphoserine/phosphohydroxythreonine transaminase [Spirochaetales bacterium]|nr:3-phosphoserine/phosphohydroxythreonine transaminase [Spirochaetales bacterium]MCF7938934.1 3-phosphoserine/phosphohydroxythreonine transaminase [Spirochaetales bacterium]